MQDIVEAVNVAEGIVHDTESKLEEFKDQLPADEVRSTFYRSSFVNCDSIMLNCMLVIFHRYIACSLAEMSENILVYSGKPTSLRFILHLRLGFVRCLDSILRLIKQPCPQCHVLTIFESVPILTLSLCNWPSA